MRVIGLNGGFDPVFEARYNFPEDYVHDAAAVLVEDGCVVAGIEEERLNRIKHTNKTAEGSIRFCLDRAGLRFGDIDAFAFYVTEPFLDLSLRSYHLHKPAADQIVSGRALLGRMFLRAFGEAPAPERLRFVNHHVTHAMSAWALSGFDDALVLAIDGAGEAVSTLLCAMRGGQLQPLLAKPVPDSLGFLYLEVIRFLGYAIYDEYKVMGLAPYGDPERFRSLFTSFYSLLPEGDYAVHKDAVMALLPVLTPRRRGAPFEQIHMDIAAALQAALEAIVFHMLRHARATTGLDRLALAGGVAQNSTLNGKLLTSGLFADVYVPPAAADSGCALGAALAVAHEAAPDRPRPRVRTAYWGRDIGTAEAVEAELRRWDGLIETRHCADVVETAADLLAEGLVLGWVQGRSEFGPRALGNRSIIADPRPAAHKDIINGMIKKREAYRPFAPSVLEEEVERFFEIPAGHTSYPFMSFVLPVREAWRATLGAITHVDGTARLQSLRRADNPRYWDLIAAFGRRSGVPILLNTSFNNNAEPIVDSVEDAVVCFLTSGLHRLVVGDCLVTRRAEEAAARADLVPALPPAAILWTERAHVAADRVAERHWIGWNYKETLRADVSPALHALLRAADGRRSFAQLVEALGVPPAERPGLLEEMGQLWDQRFIRLSPAGNGAKPPRL